MTVSPTTDDRRRPTVILCRCFRAAANADFALLPAMQFGLKAANFPLTQFFRGFRSWPPSGNA